MKITEIKKTKRGRYSVYVDDEFYGVLHPDVYFSSSIAAGQTVPRADVDQLIERSQQEIIKERAFRLLSARSYTAQGLFDKLRPHVDHEETAWTVVSRMEELGLIDDYDYAVRYSIDCLRLRGFSYFHTAYVLGQRGIDRGTAQKALESLGEEDTEWILSNFILHKYRRRIGDEDGERRTINAMIRRGHQYGQVREVLDNLGENIHYYDNYTDPYER